jgi:hypothetical protein
MTFASASSSSCGLYPVFQLSVAQHFTARSNDTQKVIDIYYTFMLFSIVYLHTELRSAESDSRCLEHPTMDPRPESAGGGGAQEIFSTARPTQFLTLATIPSSHRFPCLITLLPRIPNLCKINTYEISRKCCNQRTYRITKSFRFRTYKKQGGGVVMVNHASATSHHSPAAPPCRAHESPVTSHQTPVTGPFIAWPSTSVLRKIEPILYPEFYCSLDPSRIHSYFD